MSPPRILNVNDHDASRYLLSKTLRAAGMEILESASGLDALDALQQGVDLVLLDVHLPDLDGLEVCRRIKQNPPTRNLPVVQISAARIAPQNQVQGLEGGADAYLTLPIEPEVLVATVKAFLRLGSALHATELAAGQWAATFDAIRDVVVVFSKEGSVVRANRAAATFFGQPREALLGRPVASLLRSERGGVERVRQALAAAESLDHELTIDGKLHEVSIAPVLGAAQQEGSVLRLTDMSAWTRAAVAETARDLAIASEARSRDVLRQLEASEDRLHHQARELERSNSDLEQFAYVASHDLQEPLRMISSFTQLLDRQYRGKLDATADEYLGFVVDGAARMQRLIDDLLTYSRVSRGGETTAVDTAQLFDEVVADLRGTIAEAHAAVTRDALPTVQGDPKRLAQVFSNLLTNAMKFRANAPPEVRVSAERQGSQWRFRVADNGIGIAAKDLSRLFVLFQRLHGRAQYPGTGIGLALCKKIIERHQGTIWIESTPGQGSSVYFTLPAVGEPPTGDRT